LSQRDDAGPDDPHPDDAVVEAAGSHDELLARELGAQVIEEVPRDDKA
jgi:hypothetical protein